ncbi:hypothetical protein [Vibrio anguillarum]|uniref:hypothetical protein n=1 Tax=Vibrio anguillarum TaxID=55601 RepID=UPI0018FF03E1|nr:hypothetical protein [Vibrio anguillarum]MBF4425587.1 hypothetical protein [Vibrio anguillarum]
MITIVNEPIDIGTLLNSMATLATAIIAFAIMGINNYYSTKRLRLELKFSQEEAEKERYSRIREEMLKSKLMKMEEVLSILEIIYSTLGRYRLKLDLTILEKDSLESYFIESEKLLNKICQLDINMHIIITIYIQDILESSVFIQESLLELYELHSELRDLKSDSQIEKVYDLLGNKVKPKMLAFKDQISSLLNVELAGYIESCIEQA